jgi:hypothetical protein
MVIVGRHFGWSDDRLYDWFNQKDTLHYKIGLTPTKEALTNSKMRASLL